MPSSFSFQQVDVFAEKPLQGNALAVVSNADALTEDQMAAFARWTNLSETTFLLRPTLPDADYRVRIFTPQRELPFAGHPTLGSCHVWLDNGGVPQAKEIVQECGAGLVRIRRDGARLAFAAPPMVRSGKVDDATLARVSHGLGISLESVLDSNWVDNGPGWVAVLLSSREDALAIRADYSALKGLNVGVVAPWTGAGAEADVEVRAFIGDEYTEDPVTGSLNASLAQWLIAAGKLPQRYVSSQGTVIGRRGRVHIEKVGDDVWVGGEVQRCVAGEVWF
ncbi:PhzF family phenazine biosynthesis protein [Halopseudomonas laoshanensis]|uniref:PhzF family phenazine biosynthesis protein n=1 Tax=Halopseudomonas laoshanensis TaxID=2268758 RepID=A0A7V7GVL5_9GAMM|nr:PhzF family phenazine biosynthesis protein [Halopseudomonas laoshanensis]KAA0696215.1 PhzF family phenazine biosynthesis protein [Halopseudomonas laoshanensis]